MPVVSAMWVGFSPPEVVASAVASAGVGGRVPRRDATPCGRGAAAVGSAGGGGGRRASCWTTRGRRSCRWRRLRGAAPCCRGRCWPSGRAAQAWALHCCGTRRLWVRPRGLLRAVGGGVGLRAVCCACVAVERLWGPRRACFRARRAASRRWGRRRASSRASGRGRRGVSGRGVRVGDRGEQRRAVETSCARLSCCDGPRRRGRGERLHAAVGGTGLRAARRAWVAVAPPWVASA